MTLEGESLQPGGSMTGGAFKNNSNLLGRSREIEALEQQIARRKEEGKQIRERLEDVRTADELLKDDFDELQQSLQEATLRQNTLRVEVEHLREEKEQQENSYRALQEEMQKLEVEKQEILREQQKTLTRERDSRQRERQIRKKTGDWRKSRRRSGKPCRVCRNRSLKRQLPSHSCSRKQISPGRTSSVWRRRF